VGGKFRGRVACDCALCVKSRLFLDGVWVMDEVDRRALDDVRGVVFVGAAVVG